MTVRIGHIEAVNAKVGLTIETNEDVYVGGARFENVEKPYEVRRVGTANIRNTNIVDDPKSRNRQEGTITGWRRTIKGVPLPSHCPNCDHVFSSLNYDLSGGFFQLWGNKDVCLNCGSENATLSEGFFNLARNSIEILRAPDVTHDMVRRLGELGSQVASGLLTPSEAIRAAEAIHPDFGELVNAFMKIGIGAYFLFEAVVGTVSSTWDIADRLGMTSGSPVVTEKVLEESFKRHDELWREKLKNDGVSIFDDDMGADNGGGQSAAPTQKKPSVSAPTASKKPKSAGSQKKRQDKRKQQSNHRKTFGGARTR